MEEFRHQLAEEGWRVFRADEGYGFGSWSIELELGWRVEYHGKDERLGAPSGNESGHVEKGVERRTAQRPDSRGDPRRPTKGETGELTLRRSMRGRLAGYRAGVGRTTDIALGVGAVLIGLGMVVAALVWRAPTAWVTIAGSLLGIALLRWLTRSSRLKRSPKRTDADLSED
jgi:Flp pilus assembly protein TadB